MNNLTIYITTCDPNIFIIKYFQYFFNKYWGKHIKVKILGFSPPDFQLESNFEFVSMGEKQVGGVKGWSNHLIDFFSSINDDFFVMGLDDFMIARPVDVEVYKTCLELLDDKIGRIDLQPSLQYARPISQIEPYKEINDLKFVKLIDYGKNVNLYQNAAAFSIWNRKWFLKNIKKNWTPWDWEIEGSLKFANGDGYKVVGSLDRWAIRKLEVLSNQWPNIINVRGIRHEDLEIMKTLTKSTDRVKEFVSIQDDKWYYQVPNGDWESTIFGN